MRIGQIPRTASNGAAVCTDLCDDRHRYRGVEHHHAGAGVDSLMIKMNKEHVRKSGIIAHPRHTQTTELLENGLQWWQSTSVVSDNIALDNTSRTAIPRPSHDT